MEPYYQEAEKLYRVRGTTDPLFQCDSDHNLLPPPTFHPANEAIFSHLQRKKLHPYALHMACESVPSCMECQGFLCPKDCKNDPEKICLRPAITHYQAKLLDNCMVRKLHANSHQITSVECVRNKKILRFKAKTIILAAGAIETPLLLFRSASPMWPRGLANSSNLVGKNLMRHIIDLYVVIPKKKDRVSSFVRNKELSLNDFYLTPQGKLGTLQSFGSLPSPHMVFKELADDLKDVFFGIFRPFFLLGKPIFQFCFEKFSPQTIILASIMEDLPYEKNRIILSKRKGESPIINYHLYPNEQKRLLLFRKNIRQALKGLYFFLIDQHKKTERLAHVCGTCRFGNDPKRSVLDANNRSHDLENLYIVDASFFPSSGGTNPGLTIAANALRAANNILNNS